MFHIIVFIVAKLGVLNIDIYDKLTILSDSAKYDVACTSSGVDRSGKLGSMGSAAKAGICHSFSADGRCMSLLKVLMTNVCVFDCKYLFNDPFITREDVQQCLTGQN